jgi:hypothetical protein
MGTTRTTPSLTVELHTVLALTTYWVGLAVGISDGDAEGANVGDDEGANVGDQEGIGSAVSTNIGDAVGASVAKRTSALACDNSTTINKSMDITLCPVIAIEVCSAQLLNTPERLSR